MSRINDATGPIRWHHKRFLLRHTETFHQLFLGWRNFQVSSLSLLISEIKRPPGWLGSSMTCVTRTAEDMSTRKVSRYCICYTNYEHNFKVQYDRLTVHHTVQDMLASLIDIAKTDKIQSSDVSDLINSMLSSAGLKNKTSLSYEDFKVNQKKLQNLYRTFYYHFQSSYFFFI